MGQERTLLPSSKIARGSALVVYWPLVVVFSVVRFVVRDLLVEAMLGHALAIDTLGRAFGLDMEPHKDEGNWRPSYSLAVVWFFGYVIALAIALGTCYEFWKGTT